MVKVNGISYFTGSKNDWRRLSVKPHRDIVAAVVVSVILAAMITVFVVAF